MGVHTVIAYIFTWKRPHLVQESVGKDLFRDFYYILHADDNPDEYLKCGVETDQIIQTDVVHPDVGGKALQLNWLLDNAVQRDCLLYTSPSPRDS